MIVEKVRWFTSMLILLLASEVGLAEQPPLIAVANQGLTSRIVASVNDDIQWAVLGAGQEDDITLLNRRALAMRSARFFVYESHDESMLQAMYRERLTQQGVKAMDVSPSSQRRAFASPVDMQKQFPSLLAILRPVP